MSLFGVKEANENENKYFLAQSYLFLTVRTTLGSWAYQDMSSKGHITYCMNANIH